MAYVSVPKDLTKVKNKVAFNLTKRQLICIGIGAAMGIPSYERASPHMQVGVCYLRACDPFRFSGEYVKDDAANWFWNLYETGISGGKKVSERMSECTDGY